MEKLSGLEQKVMLAPYTTIKIGGRADWLVHVRTRQEVQQACDWAEAQRLDVFVLGEGSNVVVSDKPVHRLVMRVEIAGFEVVAEDDVSMTLVIGGGEHWDDVVKRAVEMGLSGIEAMSMIPGTMGATPVQNAGAYGQEIADTLVEVEAYDRKEHKFVQLAHKDCGFSYRMSRFKTDWAGRYVITAVTLRLSKGAPAEPTYASLRRWLDEREIAAPTVAQIREGVMAIRRRILPDPSVVPNAGSFFKNPIVDEKKLAKLRELYPEMPYFAYGDQYKLAAGWLLDQCGFKGAEYFGFKMWGEHALVITNPSRSGYHELEELVALVQRTVREKFDVELEPEPLFIQ